MSFGPDRPASAARPRLLVAAALVAGAVVGGLLGARMAEGSGQEEEAGAFELVAGGIERRPYGDENGPVFGLPLHNGSDRTVEVLDVGFDHLRSDLITDGELTIGPGFWGSVRFGPPVGCSPNPPTSLDTVLVTVRTADGERELRVPLPDGGQQMLDYHTAVCAPQVMPTVSDLVGVWVVDEAYGDQDFVDAMVWIFEPDGGWVADPEGKALLGVEHGVDGRWTLERETMRLDVHGGHGCEPGGHSHWRPSLVVDDEPGSAEMGQGLTLAWLGGECPDGMQGQVWVFRKILRGVG